MRRRRSQREARSRRLLAFLQVAAFTNRTAVLPNVRVGEPAYAGFPEAGYHRLDRYFDTKALLARWPCLRAISFHEYRAERRGRPIIDVALQLGLPRNIEAGTFGFVMAKCGKRTPPLVAAGATHACLDLTAAASAADTLAGPIFRSAAIMITNWSQKIVGLGDALSPLFGDAFVRRGGCHDPTKAAPRDFPPIAEHWLDKASSFVDQIGGGPFVCAHLRAEKLASAAGGSNRWRQSSDGAWTSPYLEACVAGAAHIVREFASDRPIVLITDTDSSHGTPSNQGSAHFRDWRRRGERVARDLFGKSATTYCAQFTPGDPDCAVIEAAICRRAHHVFRFGSGTFSEFVVGDSPDAPPNTYFADCRAIFADSNALEGKGR